MKITVGIDGQLEEADILELASLGADEFFCGIMPKEWTDVYGSQVSTNRRYGVGEHYHDWNKLQKAISAIHKANKKIIIAFNAPYYIKEHIPLLLDYVKKACDMGADALIVSDIELLLRILELNYKVAIHISSDSGAYNSQTAALFASLGAERIIFPRKMTIDEMKGVIANSRNMEYECFILEQRCSFDGAYCTATHGWRRNNFCQFDFQRAMYKHSGNDAVNIVSPDEYINWKNNRNHYEVWAGGRHPYESILTIRGFGIMQCGLYSIKKLEELGITSLKIASREYSKEIRLLSVELVKKVLSSPDFSEKYCKSGKAHPEICDMKYICYHDLLLPKLRKIRKTLVQ